MGVPLPTLWVARKWSIPYRFLLLISSFIARYFVVSFSHSQKRALHREPTIREQTGSRNSCNVFFTWCATDSLENKYGIYHEVKYITSKFRTRFQIQTGWKQKKSNIQITAGRWWLTNIPRLWSSPKYADLYFSPKYSICKLQLLFVILYCYEIALMLR